MTPIPHRVMSVFGTRPEAIKFAPVIRAMSSRPELTIFNIISSQHSDLLKPFIDLFGISIDADLEVMRPNQHPNDVLSLVVGRLDVEITRFKPDLVLVQGDTTTALAGALAAMNRGVPVGHIEAGLRSGDPDLPFPEELNRRLISQAATLHFAATESNRRNLLENGIDPTLISVTGNPVVDALHFIRAQGEVSTAIRDLIACCAGKKRIVLTTHRRENFGDTMRGYLDVLKRFVSASDDHVLLFPVHPNPAVRKAAEAAFGDEPKVVLLDPLNHTDFLQLLSEAWLIVSDSGGVQEEAPSLGKALLVLRSVTERPEGIAAGVARLVGSPEALAAELAEAAQPGSWITQVRKIGNPFGDGHAGERIAEQVSRHLSGSHHRRRRSEQELNQTEQGSIGPSPGVTPWRSEAATRLDRRAR